MGYPIKLKNGILDHMNSTFRNTVSQISVDVPLRTIFSNTFDNKGSSDSGL